MPSALCLQVVIGLLVGMIVAASTHVTTCDKEGVSRSLPLLTLTVRSRCKAVCHKRR